MLLSYSFVMDDEDWGNGGDDAGDEGTDTDESMDTDESDDSDTEEDM